jgi:hypothetical protein
MHLTRCTRSVTRWRLKISILKGSEDAGVDSLKVPFGTAPVNGTRAGESRQGLLRHLPAAAPSLHAPRARGGGARGGGAPARPDAARHRLPPPRALRTTLGEQRRAPGGG